MVIPLALAHTVYPRDAWTATYAHSQRAALIVDSHVSSRWLVCPIEGSD